MKSVLFLIGAMLCLVPISEAQYGPSKDDFEDKTKEAVDIVRRQLKTFRNAYRTLDSAGAESREAQEFLVRRSASLIATALFAPSLKSPRETGVVDSVTEIGEILESDLNALAEGGMDETKRWMVEELELAIRGQWDVIRGEADGQDDRGPTDFEKSRRRHLENSLIVGALPSPILVYGGYYVVLPLGKLVWWLIKSPKSALTFVEKQILFSELRFHRAIARIHGQPGIGGNPLAQECRAKICHLIRKKKPEAPNSDAVWAKVYRSIKGMPWPKIKKIMLNPLTHVGVGAAGATTYYLLREDETDWDAQEDLLEEKIFKLLSSYQKP